MFERERDFPRAYTTEAPGIDETDRLAVQWALEERHASGDSILLYSPGRNNHVDGHPDLRELAAKPFVQSETWRTLLGSGWRGGLSSRSGLTSSTSTR